MLHHLKKLYTANKDSGYALAEIKVVENKFNITLPKSLKEYLLTIGKMSFNQDGMFELRFPHLYEEDGYYVFYECNYMSFRWAIHKGNLTEDNPLIYEQRFFNLENVVWEKTKTNVEDGLFFMALMNGAFNGQLSYTNRALVAEDDFSGVMQQISTGWNFYKTICDNQIYFNNNFTEVILNEEYGICCGTMDQSTYSKTIETLTLNWEK